MGIQWTGCHVNGRTQCLTAEQYDAWHAAGRPRRFYFEAPFPGGYMGRNGEAPRYCQRCNSKGYIWTHRGLLAIFVRKKATCPVCLGEPPVLRPAPPRGSGGRNQPSIVTDCMGTIKE